MYIWNINALIAALREDSLTEKQKKNYRTTFWVLLAFIVLSLPIVYNPSSMNKYDFIDLISFVVINSLGLFVLIQIHKKGNKKEFLLPFISLVIPIFLRYILLFIILMVIGFIYIFIFAPFHSMEETNLIDLIISITVEIFYNLMFIHYFKKIFN
ncbi:hypothetical protein [Peribacillus alkalitolerans]|uniref:hypothetical protein n=1 Tax=Peribacillus alkalitolerans TaxID=1550385 RepID=UPI0013D46181|nr:hypothetical protein [Peribacillus alkalitolerans]